MEVRYPIRTSSSLVGNDEAMLTRLMKALQVNKMFWIWQKNCMIMKINYPETCSINRLVFNLEQINKRITLLDDTISHKHSHHAPVLLLEGVT